MAVQVLNLNLDCQSCDEVLQKERGCTEKGIIPFVIEGEHHYRCPLKVVTPLSWEYISAYGLYKKSILPNGKGWLNESDKFLTAMRIVDSEVSKIEAEQIEKVSKRGKKHSSSKHSTKS